MKDKNKITIKPANSVYSGHELVIIPENPHYKPTINQINAALDIIQKEYTVYEITSELYDSVNFIDPGQNFEKVSCNHCLKELSMDFWHEKMAESYDGSHFDEMNFKTKCCNKITSLNELIYDGDCGFASYEISINNAEPDDNKENELKKNLSIALGTKVKLFWRNI